MTETLTIPPPRPLEYDVLPVAQIADLAGVKPTAVTLWRTRHTQKAYDEAAKVATTAEEVADLRRKTPFPVADDSIGANPIWRLERVVAWLKITGRAHDEAAWRKKRDRGDYRRARYGGITEINKTRQRAAAAAPKKKSRKK